MAGDPKKSVSRRRFVARAEVMAGAIESMIKAAPSQADMEIPKTLGKLYNGLHDEAFNHLTGFDEDSYPGPIDLDWLPKYIELYILLKTLAVAVSFEEEEENPRM